MKIESAESNIDGWQEWLFVSLFFAGLSILFTWPLILHVAEAVVGRYGDNMHFVWMQGWYVETLLEQGVLPYEVPILNYPEGWNLARSEIPTTLLLMGLIPAALGSPVLGYNFAVLLSFVLSGLSAYLLVHNLTGSIWAGLIAGAAYAVLPFRIAHFRAGHLNVLATMWYPLIFLGIIQLIKEPQQGRRFALLAGLGFGLLAHSSMYATYLALLTIGVSLSGYILIWRRDLLAESAFWKCLGWMALIGVPLIVTAAWPYLRLAAEGGIGGRSVFAVTGGSASLSDFILPSTDHFLWGSWVAEYFSRDQWIEGSLYVGAITGPLALLGLMKLLRSENKRWLGLILASIGLVALILSMGTHLHWNEQLIRVVLPEFFAQRIGQPDFSIRLPVFYLYQILPFFDSLRTFKRIAVVLLLVVSTLAGFGVVELSSGFKRVWLAPLLLGLILFDFYPGPFKDIAPVGPRPVDLWLRQQPEQGAVADFPFHLQTEQINVYYTLEHGKPYLGGFFNAFPPNQFRQVQPVLQGFPNSESVQMLDELGVTVVLANREFYSGQEFTHLLASSQEQCLNYIGDLGVNSILVLGPQSSECEREAE